MAWYDEFNSVFFLSICSLCVGIVAYCFKSKCSECSICGGVVHIVRNVETEVQEQQFEITHPQEQV